MNRMSLRNRKRLIKVCRSFHQFQPSNTRSRSEYLYWEQDRLNLAAANNEYLNGRVVRLQHWLHALYWATAAITRSPTPHRKKSSSSNHPEKGILNLDNNCLFSQLESFLGGKTSMVRPRRFELLTYSFGGCRSIQLSYGRALLA